MNFLCTPATSTRRTQPRLALLVVVALLQAAAVFPAQASKLMALKGQVLVERKQETVNLSVGSVVLEADTLVVAPDGEALLRFKDGALMVLRSDSRVTFDKLVQAGAFKKRKKTLRVLKGTVRYVSGKLTHQVPVAFETNSVSIGIRGTDIEIAVADEGLAGNPAGTYLKVNTGQAVLVGLDGTQVEVEPGQVAFGSEPELTPRGGSGVRRPAARRIEGASTGLFKAGSLDSLLR